MTQWRRFVERVIKPKKHVKIALVGKYTDHKDAYKSILESITHAAASCDCRVEVKQVESERFETGDPAVSSVTFPAFSYRRLRRTWY
jgi:CTP synthase